MCDSQIPIEKLREAFDYNPRTGAFLHRHSGKPTGSANDNGYLVVKVKLGERRVQIAVHKAAFAIHHGFYARDDVDHRDTDRKNNRIRNLRDATKSQNMANTRRRGALPKGVTASGRPGKPYKAQIRLDGRCVTLGRYASPGAAHAAYVAKAVEVHGEFARAR